MALRPKPNVIYHADWGSKDKKRWCAKAILGADGRYTVFAPEPVGPPSSLIGRLREQAGHNGCAFAGFDFPIGIPASYAQRAGIAKFRAWLPTLGSGDWKEFWSVCDDPAEIAVHRPFYPNGKYKGKSPQDLLCAHGVQSMDELMRRCERGGNGQKRACCLFWTLGGNQVGKAAIIGWRDMLAPAMRSSEPMSLWPFDGDLHSVLRPGNVVIAETFPAECYGWFSRERLGSKQTLENRKKFGASLLGWAGSHSVALTNPLTAEIQNGLPQGEDAFDAVVGLFGMLEVCLGQRDSGEPEDIAIREIEGWILGRKPQPRPSKRTLEHRKIPGQQNPIRRRTSTPRMGKIDNADIHSDNQPIEASFGIKEDWQHFSKSHQMLLRKLPLLFKTFERVFLRTMETTEPADRVIYFLGRVAMEDFMEIVLLCGNGYGIGALKILRGLYERAVTAAYIAKFPQELDSFLDYHQVHMGKLLNHTDELFDVRKLFSESKLTEIRERYELAKQHFQEPLCKKCGTNRTRFSWSKLDVGAMAKKADEYLAKLYLECYFLPTLQSHSTFHALSAQARQSEAGGLTYDDNAQRNTTDGAFRGAHLTMLLALGTQNRYFKLGLDEELGERRGDFAEAWGKTPDDVAAETLSE